MDIASKTSDAPTKSSRGSFDDIRAKIVSVSILMKPPLPLPHVTGGGPAVDVNASTFQVGALNPLIVSASSLP